MGSQGFRNIAGNPFVYQEDTRSAAFGLDAAATKWKLSVKATAGALPTDTAQLTIDPATNGDVTIDPNGSGNLVVTSGNVSLTAGNLALPTTSSTVGQITSNGTKVLHFYGTNNLFLGPDSGNFTLTVANAAGNVGVGGATLAKLTTGSYNNAYGVNAGRDCTEGYYNTFFGQAAGYQVTTGYQNQCIGHQAGPKTTTGYNNILIGELCGYDLASDSKNNIYVYTRGSGGLSAENNTLRLGETTGTGDGQINAAYICGIYGKTFGATNGMVFIDNANKLGSTNSPSVTGTYTTSAGNFALPTTTSSAGQITINGSQVFHTYGTDNLFIGGAGNFTTSGTGNNIGLGSTSLTHLSTGIRNIALGAVNQHNITDGSYNCSIGVSSLYTATSSVCNMAIGYASLYNTTTGNGNNVAIGTVAGFSLTTGANNVMIGGTNNYPTITTGTGTAYTSTESNNILIHNTGVVGESNKIRIGTYGTGVCQQDTAYIAGVVHCTNGLTVDTGNATITSGNLILPVTSSTVGQITQNSQTLFHTFTPVASIAELNMFVGKASGNFTLGTGTFGCVGFGPNTLTGLTTNAKGNTAFGADTLYAVSSGRLNIGFGIGSGYGLTTGIQNTLIGSYVAQGLVGGNYNLAIGLGNTTWETGSFNGAGQAWTGNESSNILINNAGVAGESNVMRIGTSGSGNAQVNKCYIAGSYGVTPGGTINVALIDSNGQLGSTTDVSSFAGSFSWAEVTGTSQAAAVNYGYITNNAGLVTVTLPSTAAIGQRVAIVGKGAGLWKLAQNSGQTVHFGSIDSTTGTGGYLAATVRYDSVEVVCITANTDWVVRSSVGSITTV